MSDYIKRDDAIVAYANHEVMEEVFGADALKNYCLIAAFKYLWR